MTRHRTTPSDTIGSPIGTLRSAIWDRDEGICGLCGEPADPLEWNVDHIVPRALDGPTVLDNLRVTHPRCNRRRGQPWSMSEETIAKAAEDWTANEIARFVLEDDGVRIHGPVTPALLEMWWEMWAFYWSSDGLKRKRALVPVPVSAARGGW